MHCDYIGCVVFQVKEGGMKRHVLCLTSVFSFSVHITKLSKIRTYFKVMVKYKKDIKVVTTKNLVNTNLAKKFR